MLGEKKSKKRIALLTMLMMLITTFVPSVSVFADETDVEYTHKYTEIYKYGYSVSYGSNSSGNTCMFSVYDTEKKVTNYTYCCDLQTYTQNNHMYRRTNIENAEHFDDYTARKIRNVVTNGYHPGKDMATIQSNVNKWLESQGETRRLNMDLTGYGRDASIKTMITATQVSIWTLANPTQDPKYNGGDNTIAANIDMICDYLLSLPEVDPVALTIEDIDLTVSIAKLNGATNNTVSGTFSFWSSSDEPRVKVQPPHNATIKVIIENGWKDNTIINDTLQNLIDAGTVTYDKNTLTYRFDIETSYANNKSVKDISIQATGRQTLPEGAYFYKAQKRYDENGKLLTEHKSSQNFVGLATWTKDFSVNGTHEPEAAAIVLNASKILENPDDPGNVALKEGQFAFELRENSAEGAIVDVASNDADGNVAFEQIAYAKKNATYEYVIKEVAGADSDIIYDNSQYNVSVNVALNNEGNAYVATAAITKVTGNNKTPVDEIAFNNKVKSAAKLQLTAIKTLQNGTLEEGQFTFALKDSAGKVIDTATNDKDGNILFDAITYEKKVAAYKYTVTEVAGDDAGIIYDGSVYDVTVNVEEAATGYEARTTIKKSKRTVDSITFTNKTRSAAALQLTANKLLNNKAPGEGNVFNFTLKNSEGETIGMAANDAEGQIYFTPLAFNEVGTYTYYINEKLGTDAIVYDSTVHSVEVQVTAPANSESFAAKVTKIDGKAYTGASSQLPITFSNASMGAAQIKLQAVKTVDGNVPGANNIFTFHLKTKAGALVQEVKSDANGNVVFDFPSAAAVGQFEYTVSEVNEGRHDVIYDETVYDITVDVTRNTEGTALVATPSITKAGEAVTAMVFDNQTRGAAELQLSANKTLDGNAPGSGNLFQFQLKKQDVAAGEVLVSTAQNDAQGKITFDKITFDAPGTYTYTISETKGLGQFKYDGTVHTVEIDVTAPEGVDNYQAKVVKVDGQEYNGTSDLPIEFKNVTIAPATLALTANKTIDDKTPGEGNTFTFQLKDKDGKVVKETKNAADGKISFSELTFTEPGTYEYTISEVTEVGQHFIYDTTVHNVTVNVGLNSDGTAYTASVVGPAEVKFNNVTRAPAKVQLAAVKTLEGGTLTDGQFSFLIESADGEYKETKANAADGKINFSELTFTEAGTYEYTISEVAGDGNIKYDDSNYNIRIVVTAPEDNKSAYEADVYVNGYAYAGKDAAQITFNNVVIQPAKIALTASKLLDGKTPAAEQFSFQLKDEEGKVLQTVSNKADGSITFASIDYDIPEDGTAQYKYTISEVTETGKAILYDESVYDVTVDIELNEDGTAYVATPTITKNGEVAEPVFNNTTRGPVALELTANKTLDGNVPGDSQFTFELKSADGKYKETKTNAADGKISFDELTFDKEGTYKYTVSETAGTDAIKYDETVYDVEIKVYAPEDNSSKDLAAEIYVDGIKYDKAQDLPLTFKNITIKAAEIQLKASKLLDGKTPEEGQFSFQLKDEAGNVLQTVSNKADGSIVFDPIDYGKSADTYKYTISEVDGGKDSIMYDETVYDVTVDVALDEQGTAYTATTKTNNIVFNNATIKPATLVLTAEKLLGGEAPAEEYEGKFAFQLRDENYEVVSEAINGKDGKVIFEKMTFNKAGTYYYTMSEVPGNVKNVIYDGTTYIVKVDVELRYGVQPLSLDAEPQGPCYVATPTIMNSAAMIDEDGSDEIITAKFHNSFVQPAKGQFVALRATKPGVASPDKETDTFVLKDEDGNELQKKYNDEDGNVEFDEIEFPKEEGTYKYTIVKNPWDEKNVVYDESTYTAIVKVTYIEEKESYEAEVKYFEGDINPDNTSDKEAKDIPSFEDIRIAPATLQLKASKTLDGKAPAADQFTFQLKDEAGEVIQTTTNNAEGKILFDEISYDDEGEYTYTISEVKGTDEGIVYDETIYTIRVKVETNEELKQYVTEIDCSADEILFENETVKPAEVPLDVSTDTGDHSCMILWAMMLLTSLTIMVLILVMSRRRNSQQA